MAFAPTLQGPSSITNRGPFRSVFPGNTVKLADQTFTTLKVATAQQPLVVNANRFRVVIYVKTLVLGANLGALSGPVFYLEASDDAGLATNLTIIGGVKQAANVASATAVQVLEWEVGVPVAGKLHVAIVADPTLMGTASSGTYDAYIESSN